MTWFESLFGYRESDWQSTKDAFRVEGTALLAPNGRVFDVGEFSTPSLGELRRRGREAGRSGSVTVSHEAIGDVLELHAVQENRGALFQVASQLNCLEFPWPDSTPEEGVTAYAHDRTQGPACSLAAAAATVYRNYFAPVDGQPGQRRDRQIDTLADVAAALGEPDAYFTVRNGYTSSEPERLTALAEALRGHDRDEVLKLVRIGVQTGVGVTFASRWNEPEEPTHVSQAFCSAISCGYTPNVPIDHWEPLATLVLDAAYEATLWAAVLDAAEGSGSGEVWLTFIGGGVFKNPPAWIGGAIKRALRCVEGFGLRVRIAHYRCVNTELRDIID